MSMDLEAMLCAARDGEDGAWARLLADLSPRLYEYFRRWFDHDDAEDLAQATLVIVVRDLQDFEPRVSLRGWVFGIAQNLARNEFRDRDRRRAVREAEQITPAPETGLSTQLGRREVEQILLEEIAELPDHQRRVIEHDLEEGDPEEFIARENITRTTMRTRRYRATGELRERVEARCETPRPEPRTSLGQARTPSSPPPN